MPTAVTRLHTVGLQSTSPPYMQDVQCADPASAPCMQDESSPEPEAAGGRLVVGLTGFPNVGKSSTINALFGSKKTAVAATPGKTKHFQTLNVTPCLTLCDCPGLVLPTYAASKADLVAAGGPPAHAVVGCGIAAACPGPQMCMRPRRPACFTLRGHCRARSAKGTPLHGRRWRSVGWQLQARYVNCSQPPECAKLEFSQCRDATTLSLGNAVAGTSQAGALLILAGHMHVDSPAYRHVSTILVPLAHSCS